MRRGYYLLMGICSETFLISNGSCRMYVHFKTAFGEVTATVIKNFHHCLLGIGNSCDAASEWRYSLRYT